MRFNVKEPQPVEEMPSEWKWEDTKQMKNKKEGGFTEEETQKLKVAICDYVSQNNLGVNGLERICSSKDKEEFKGAWTKIAEVLPKRSVDSIYKHCRRWFNVHNYQGEWNISEEQQLLESVEKIGHEWVQIGETLNRTPENVRDKWRELGGKNNKKRWKGEWRLDEKVELIHLVNEAMVSSGKPGFVKWKILLELSRFKDVDSVDMKEWEKLVGLMDEKHWKVYEAGLKKGKESLHIYRDMPLENFKDKFISEKSHVPFDGIPWNLVSGKLKVRSYDDCWNMWYQNIYLTLSDSSWTHTKDNDIAFLRGIIS